MLRDIDQKQSPAWLTIRGLQLPKIVPAARGFETKIATEVNAVQTCKKRLRSCYFQCCNGPAADFAADRGKRRRSPLASTSPIAAVEALNAEYGVKISPQSAERYDPTKRAGARLAQHLTRLIGRTRTEFLANIDSIPDANKAVRIRQLALASRVLKAKGNYRDMADMLERIAKEVGDVYSHRREITGHCGGPLRADYSDLTDEQLNARIAQRLGITGLTVLDEEKVSSRSRGSGAFSQ